MPLSETVLILAGLLSVAILAAGLFRNVPIPYTVLLVVIGMALGEWSKTSAALAPLAEFRLSPDLVFFIFLPALIFESGLNLDARQLLRDLTPVLVLAIPALIISTVVIGFGMSQLGIDLVTALLFGALISATDPVAVVALFKELGAPERLTVLVEGESLLNDATAIVVFSIILGVAVGGGELGWSDLDTVILEFVRVFVGGALVGALLGFLVSEALYRLHSGVTAVLTMSLVIAYGSFVLAEHTLHVSGVMAGAAAAVTLAGFGMTRLKHEASAAAVELWEVIALVCNSLLFLLVGLSVDMANLAAALVPGAAAVVLVLVSRAAAVYTLVPLTTRLFSLPRVSVSEQHIMWWGGLKGGLAIAIALSIPEDLPGRQLLLDITLAVVVFTLLVNAPSIRPLMSKLKLDRLSDEEDVELHHAMETAQLDAENMLERLADAGLVSDPAQREVREVGDTTFGTDHSGDDGSAGTRDLYLVIMLALRHELKDLNALYGIGLISQHVFLDLRNGLGHERKLLMEPAPAAGVETLKKRSVFLRVETAMIRFLQEKNWAARMLSAYQKLRLSEHMRREIAHILSCESVLKMLYRQSDLHSAAVASVANAYERRLDRYRKRVSGVQREFPEFYRGFESHLFTLAALNSSMRHLRDMHSHGGIGTKVFNIIDQRVNAKLMDLAPISRPTLATTSDELRRDVALFKDYKTNSLVPLGESARTAVYLPGDTIIAHYETGDAFYIITRGEVEVFMTSQDDETRKVGELSAGEFFGETALIVSESRSHARSATIKAKTPVTLLRFPHEQMLEFIKDHPDLRDRLQEINRSRTSG